MIPVSRNNSHRSMICSIILHIKGAKDKRNCPHTAMKSHKKSMSSVGRSRAVREKSKEPRKR